MTISALECFSNSNKKLSSSSITFKLWCHFWSNSCSGTTIILNDPRFMVDYEKDTSTYTLKIEEVQETDGAIYQVLLFRAFYLSCYWIFFWNFLFGRFVIKIHFFRWWSKKCNDLLHFRPYNPYTHLSQKYDFALTTFSKETKRLTLSKNVFLFVTVLLCSHYQLFKKNQQNNNFFFDFSKVKTKV